MRALSNARSTGVRLYTFRIKIGTNQRALGELPHCYPHALFKKALGILQSPPSVRPSVCPSFLIMLSSPKPLDEIQPNFVCELLT